MIELKGPRGLVRGLLLSLLFVGLGASLYFAPRLFISVVRGESELEERICELQSVNVTGPPKLNLDPENEKAGEKICVTTKAIHGKPNGNVDKRMVALTISDLTRCDFEEKKVAEKEGVRIRRKNDGVFQCFLAGGENGELQRTGDRRSSTIFVSVLVLPLYLFLVYSFVAVSLYIASFKFEFCKKCLDILTFQKSRRRRAEAREEGRAFLLAASAARAPDPVASARISKRRADKLVSKFSILKTDPSSPDDVCSICLEAGLKAVESPGSKDTCCQVELPGCGHSFHKHCISKWLTLGKESCPVCRSAIAGARRP